MWQYILGSELLWGGEQFSRDAQWAKLHITCRLTVQGTFGARACQRGNMWQHSTTHCTQPHCNCQAPAPGSIIKTNTKIHLFHPIFSLVKTKLIISSTQLKNFTKTIYIILAMLKLNIPNLAFPLYFFLSRVPDLITISEKENNYDQTNNIFVKFTHLS